MHTRDVRRSVAETLRQCGLTGSRWRFPEDNPAMTREQQRYRNHGNVNVKLTVSVSVNVDMLSQLVAGGWGYAVEECIYISTHHGEQRTHAVGTIHPRFYARRIFNQTL